jgi:hypothetical protein
MNSRKLILACVLFAALVIAGGNIWVNFGQAADEPERKLELIIPFTETTWWLTRWSNNQIECTVPTDHDGLPTHNEVYYACGENLYDDWVETPLCSPDSEGEVVTETCDGLYLFLASKQPRDRTVVIDLPLPTVWLSLADCTLSEPENLCESLPTLTLTGEEPLPNEEITAIHVLYMDEVFDCAGAVCSYPLPITQVEGGTIEFWAESSFGDTTETYTAQLRVIDGGINPKTGEPIWYVDVLSPQWQGDEIASCAQVWDVLPPIGGPPDWLSTPEHLGKLATDAPYVYLAGRLIAQGAIDTSSCPSGGLLPNGHANTCGLELARDAVNDWQDTFDSAILEVAKKTNVPAQLMKNLFAVESQFWPGIFLPQEYGLGQITEQGADAALLWNPVFFSEFCPLVLDETVCAEGYLHLIPDEQAMVRGALAVRTDSTCLDCPLGIDLAHAEFSIDVFANTLLGNCEQAGRVIQNTTGKPLNETNTYEDLWRFTLVNYNAGPGCLSLAAQTGWRVDRALDWTSMSRRLETACENTAAYVDLITTGIAEIAGPTPTPTASPAPSGPYPPPSTPAYP